MMGTEAGGTESSHTIRPSPGRIVKASKSNVPWIDTRQENFVGWPSLWRTAQGGNFFIIAASGTSPRRKSRHLSRTDCSQTSLSCVMLTPDLGWYIPIWSLFHVSTRWKLVAEMAWPWASYKRVWSSLPKIFRSLSNNCKKCNELGFVKCWAGQKYSALFTIELIPPIMDQSSKMEIFGAKAPAPNNTEWTKSGRRFMQCKVMQHPIEWATTWGFWPSCIAATSCR